MNEQFIFDILKKLKEGSIDVDYAYQMIKDLPYFSIEHLKFDLHRKIRRGLPEVVYGAGKSLETLTKIIKYMNERKENLLMTRVSYEHGIELHNRFKNSHYDEVSKVFFLKNKRVVKKGRGKILILSAGNSDLPIAKEAFLCAEYLGNDVELISDIGIAGIHRVSDFKDKIHSSICIIVVAGMEGALPSYIASICDKPIIGVPTSIGYGANLGGITALFGMLCNCSGGVAVVNIDNGFGAAYFATLINKESKK
ncbi:MAG: nickel pincer cofactor biosynthesis protein LarB [Proteobacteria bacterium]|nr:nickel pincer cofactor biosynthesis protein LarB [Pseudomonadota bacterium]